jgi:hypothetical protein
MDDIVLETWRGRLDAAHSALNEAKNRYNTVYGKRDDIIAAALQAGVPTDTIQKHMKVSYYTVTKVREERGLGRRKSKPRRDTDTKARNLAIINAYRRLNSLQDVAEQFGLTRSRVHQIIRHYDRERGNPRA